MNILVAYFSATGTTKKAAQDLAKGLDADAYEIKPEKLYTSEDLNWMDKKSRSSIEMQDKTSRPEIVKGDIDISKYDKILIGYPVWWYTVPTIINSFLEAYEFSNKDIVLWATSGGSGFGSAKNDLSKSTKANISEGMILNSSNAINEFIKKMRG